MNCTVQKAATLSSQKGPAGILAGLAPASLSVYQNIHVKMGDTVTVPKANVASIGGKKKKGEEENADVKLYGDVIPRTAA